MKKENTYSLIDIDQQRGDYVLATNLSKEQAQEDKSHFDDRFSIDCEIVLEDLFDFPERIPEAIQKIMDSADEDKDPYKECERMLGEMSVLGYTFEYGLDGVPFGLEKMDEEDFLHIEAKKLLDEMGFTCSLDEVNTKILNKEYYEKVQTLLTKFNEL